MMEPMTTHPRDDLFRMVELPGASLEIRAADEGGDGNTMTGYPITWNQWTEINGWEGNFLERIAPGATKKTLADRGDKVKVLFNHGFDPHIGEKPLGKPATMTPDDRGLYTETPLVDTSYNEDLRKLLAAGVIDGMSFRFSVVREDWNDDPERSETNPKGLPERTIHELKLYEFGPVTFPAYAGTSAGVRSRSAFEVWRTANQATVDGPLVPHSDEIAEDHRIMRAAADLPEISPADSGTADPGIQDEAPDTPPTLAPAGNDKRKRYMRLADSMDRTVAAALRNI